mmetsp:Transcript_4267/g.12463  ORF Transcript_4267/g.12463 Transcript_4267/m.12463 type:complete len:236 (-) Transcript_4267:81-788(-)
MAKCKPKEGQGSMTIFGGVHALEEFWVDGVKLAVQDEGGVDEAGRLRLEGDSQAALECGGGVDFCRIFQQHTKAQIYTRSLCQGNELGDVQMEARLRSMNKRPRVGGRVSKVEEHGHAGVEGARIALGSPKLAHNELAAVTHRRSVNCEESLPAQGGLYVGENGVMKLRRRAAIELRTPSQQQSPGVMPRSLHSHEGQESNARIVNCLHRPPRGVDRSVHGREGGGDHEDGKELP